MNLKRSPFSILNKKSREIDYIKGVYKRKIQAEIESYKDPEDEDKRDTIQAQDVLMLDRISKKKQKIKRKMLKNTKKN
jgi:hypothetical protein